MRKILDRYKLFFSDKLITAGTIVIALTEFHEHGFLGMSCTIALLIFPALTVPIDWSRWKHKRNKTDKNADRHICHK
jgi:hypothetical protein